MKIFSLSRQMTASMITVVSIFLIHHHILSQPLPPLPLPSAPAPLDLGLPPLPPLPGASGALPQAALPAPAALPSASPAPLDLGLPPLPPLPGAITTPAVSASINPPLPSVSVPPLPSSAPAPLDLGLPALPPAPGLSPAIQLPTPQPFSLPPTPAAPAPSLPMTPALPAPIPNIPPVIMPAPVGAPAVVPVVASTPPATTPMVPGDIPVVGSPALDAFPQGTRVALMVDKAGVPSFLKVDSDGKSVKALGSDPKDGLCQFIVHRLGNWVGFKSEAASNNFLVADPVSFAVRCDEKKFADPNDTVAHWFVQFSQPNDARQFVTLQNRATKSFLSILPTGEASAAPSGLAGQFKLAKLEIAPPSSAPVLASKGKSFSFEPGKDSSEKLVYASDWRLKKIGSGYVKFDARSKGGIVVGFAADPGQKDLYLVTIGEKNNTQTTLRKRMTGFIFFAQDTLRGANRNSVVTGGLPGDGTAWAHYWVRVDNGIVSFGKSEQVGENELFTWQDPNPALQVEYVGFSGSTYPVEIKNIDVGGADENKNFVIKAPAGFSHDGGGMKKISVGSRRSGGKDELALWAVRTDGRLAFWKAGRLAGEPWMAHDARDDLGNELKNASDVAISSDGNLYAVFNGKLYAHDWKTAHWSAMKPAQVMVSHIAAGRAGNVWGLEKTTGKLYEWTPSGWSHREDGCAAIVVGFDGSIFAINQQGFLHEFNGKVWNKIQVDIEEKPEKILVDSKVSVVAVVNRSWLIAITSNGDLIQLHRERQGDRWHYVAGSDGTGPASGLTDVSANAAGSVAVVSVGGDVFRRGNAGVRTMMVPAQSKRPSKSSGQRKQQEVVRSEAVSAPHVAPIVAPVAAAAGAHKKMKPAEGKRREKKRLTAKKPQAAVKQLKTRKRPKKNKDKEALPVQ